MIIQKNMEKKPCNLIEDAFDEAMVGQYDGAILLILYRRSKPFAFTGIKTIIATETISSTTNTPEVIAQWRYYVTSHDADNPNLSRYVRDHWSIENEYHWQLDVHLNDDKDKKYDDVAAENFARTKRLLLNLVKIKQPEGKKRSVRSRLKRVAWDLDYLLTLLAL
ncbi:ISAs1 family transposase [Legionella feeleii]|uniref:Transposase IS4 family protein n=1 Tax=Legionella feeleii TaxID=453 RepID=A0A2X1QUS7_9GAMM|nr:ISAs1 family transposase [Legionella feeleii]SPX61866.1 Transposase IS4 family protein [Legionella feeleii]